MGIIQKQNYLCCYMKIDGSNKHLITSDPEGNILIIDFVEG
jgi:hypothetical protein